MIVKFRILRKDTKAPIQGAKIVLEHGETDGITNSAGEVEIVVFWSGNLLYSVDASGYTKVSGTVTVPSSGTVTLVVELGAYAAPSVPPPSGEAIIGTVGQSCDILEKSMFGTTWFRHRNRYNANASSWDSSYSDAVAAANGDKSCFDPPPPPPKTANDVQKDVDILRGTLQGISSRIEDIVTSITETETALLDLEARIKAWISDMILEVLIAKLMEGRKLDTRR